MYSMKTLITRRGVHATDGHVDHEDPQVVCAAGTL